MADNVHFATVEDTDTSKSSGFTGFPAPWVQDITGVEGNYPNVVAFTKLIKWFWRAKRWTIATDFSFTAGANTLTLDNGVTGGGNVNSVPALTTSEKQLVFQGTIGPGTSLNFTAAGTGSITATLLIFIDALIDPTVLKPAIFYNSGALKPALQIDIQIDVVDNPAVNRLKIIYSSNNTVIPTPDGSIVVPVDSENITVFYKVQINIGTTSFTATSLALTITEFFPYAASDGSPIWNTSTGAQLQNENN